VIFWKGVRRIKDFSLIHTNFSSTDSLGNPPPKKLLLEEGPTVVPALKDGLDIKYLKIATFDKRIRKVSWFCDIRNGEIVFRNIRITER
jgi:hypothetical protein